MYRGREQGARVGVGAYKKFDLEQGKEIVSLR